MDRNQIMDAIAMFSTSQGFYGRLLESFIELEENDPQMYEEVMNELEAQNFGSRVEMVMFFEC